MTISGSPGDSTPPCLDPAMNTFSEGELATGEVTAGHGIREPEGQLRTRGDTGGHINAPVWDRAPNEAEILAATLTAILSDGATVNERQWILASDF